MALSEWVTLFRDCEAIQIPNGSKVTLYKGTEVMITQSLGGAYTVATHQGLMASVASKDADAIGKEPLAAAPAPSAAGPSASVDEQVWARLRTCYDPEIPHNIVDLGLIYECKIDSVSENDPENKKVFIKMTLTAPGCGMGDWLKQDARNKILTIPNVKDCEVQVVFDPPWNPGMMNPALRRELHQ